MGILGRLFGGRKTHVPTPEPEPPKVGERFGQGRGQPCPFCGQRLSIPYPPGSSGFSCTNCRHQLCINAHGRATGEGESEDERPHREIREDVTHHTDHKVTAASSA